MERNTKINIALAKISEACEYIEELKAELADAKADTKLLDKLKEWLATGSVEGLCGEAKWKEGFLAAIYSVQELLEEQDHE